MKYEFQMIAQELMETAKRLMVLADKLPDDGQATTVDNEIEVEVPVVMSSAEFRDLATPYFKANKEIFKRTLDKYGVKHLQKITPDQYHSFLADLKGGTVKCVH